MRFLGGTSDGGETMTSNLNQLVETLVESLLGTFNERSGVAITAGGIGLLGLIGMTLWRVVGG
jgi:hypothetical protein